ncbi:MAG TPA: signal peptidase II [Sedimentibacter sp.]|jgi:signal peptidase II|nr:signal peptidase II [Sedimentibacter sp.]HAS92732.1 signal peptidase II [Clostridiales bacterium]HOA19664.1 signal peptidase II [Sedimentibacter sp.]HOG62136.1 signal peptidase II [Sedimentibacter sp.]HPB78706.1 signal peptidase II [Sedimentibacter sp.]
MSIIAVFIIIFSVVFDQLSKYWATEVLKNGESIKIIGNFLRFTYAENRGAAFSILQNQRVFFLIITIIMLIILGIVYFTNRNLSKLSRLSMAMIAGGAIGNFIDRYRMGYVIDFIDVRFGTFYNFPVFNIADSFVVCGTILMVILILFNKFETS